jgi:hypothetical protein
MPTVVENTVRGFASCADPLCPGYEQEQVDVVRREQQFSYLELGGDLPGIERSVISAPAFVDAADATCGHCGRDRFASLESRPEYPRSSGQDPLRLLNMTNDQQVRDMTISSAEQRAELAELRAEVAEMKAARRQKGTAA